MNKTSNIKTLVEEVVLRELGQFAKKHPSHSLKALLNPDGTSAAGHQKLGEMEPEELEKVLKNLLKKKHGTAVFKKSDMELLDKLTRWMTYIPGGTFYRRNLAKYLRSKKDKAKQDPFKDFRRYSYDTSQDDMLEEETINPFLEEEEEKEKEIIFYHGTSANMKPGGLVLPPSKTGKQSERDRKKNLDVVFFTTSPRSALIYAGRAAQSLGGRAMVYVVEPQGPVGILNDTSGTEVYYAPYAKVIRPASKEELAKPKK